MKHIKKSSLKKTKRRSIDRKINKKSRRKSNNRKSNNRKSNNRKKKSSSNSKLINVAKVAGAVGALGAAGLATGSYKNKEKELDYEESSIINTASSKLKEIDENYTHITVKDSKNFLIRGPDYEKNKVKILAKEPLYKIKDVKIYKSNMFIDYVPSKNECDLIINIYLQVDENTYYYLVFRYIINTDMDKKSNKFNKFNKFNEYLEDNTDNLKLKSIITLNEIDKGNTELFADKTKDRIKGLLNNKASILSKTVIKRSVNDINVIDINISGFSVPFYIKPILISFGININPKKLGKFLKYIKNINLDIGFVIEEDNNETLICGINISDVNINYTYETSDYSSRELSKIEKNINSKDINTISKEEEYSQKSIRILDFIKYKERYEERYEERYKEYKKILDTRKNKRSFLYFARYFWYLNKNNTIYRLSSDVLSYSAGKNTYIAKGTCFYKEHMYNEYKCTQNGINTYRFGLSVNNAYNTDTNYSSMIKNAIIKLDAEDTEKKSGIFSWFSNLFNGSSAASDEKNIICISLITPCDTILCKAVKSIKFALPKNARESLAESDILDSESISIEKESADIFLSVPLSMNKKYIKLFTKNADSKGNQRDINLFDIDISSPENIFKTIVNITITYYEKYKDTHNLCYHCKSGKDRTSICDAIVQSTIYHYTQIKNKKEEVDYDTDVYPQIRKDCKYFLYFGLIISFYSTGIMGLKMNNMPIAKYILDNEDDYIFFSGNSKLSDS